MAIISDAAAGAETSQIPAVRWRIAVPYGEQAKISIQPDQIEQTAALVSPLACTVIEPDIYKQSVLII
jgi:hypothetical protein